MQNPYQSVYLSLSKPLPAYVLNSVVSVTSYKIWIQKIFFPCDCFSFFISFLSFFFLVCVCVCVWAWGRVFLRMSFNVHTKSCLWEYLFVPSGGSLSLSLSSFHLFVFPPGSRPP